jgi:hypothetical protein
MFISVPDWIRIRPTVPDPDQGHKVTPTGLETVITQNIRNPLLIRLFPSQKIISRKRFFVGTLTKTLAKYVRIYIICAYNEYIS